MFFRVCDEPNPAGRLSSSRWDCSPRGSDRPSGCRSAHTRCTRRDRRSRCSRTSAAAPRCRDSWPWPRGTVAYRRPCSRCGRRRTFPSNGSGRFPRSRTPSVAYPFTVPPRTVTARVSNESICKSSSLSFFIAPSPLYVRESSGSFRSVTDTSRRINKRTILYRVSAITERVCQRRSVRARSPSIAVASLRPPFVLRMRSAPADQAEMRVGGGGDGAGSMAERSAGASGLTITSAGTADGGCC